MGDHPRQPLRPGRLAVCAGSGRPDGAATIAIGRAGSDDFAGADVFVVRTEDTECACVDLIDPKTGFGFRSQLWPVKAELIGFHVIRSVGREISTDEFDGGVAVSVMQRFVWGVVV